MRFFPRARARERERSRVILHPRSAFTLLAISQMQRERRSRTYYGGNLTKGNKPCDKSHNKIQLPCVRCAQCACPDIECARTSKSHKKICRKEKYKSTRILDTYRMPYYKCVEGFVSLLCHSFGGANGISDILSRMGTGATAVVRAFTN